MRRALLPLVLAAGLALGGCADDPSTPPADEAASTGYSQDVRDNFLSSCLENATNSATGEVSEQQLRATCECILGKVELEYSESEFAEFEQRLLSGEATDEESARLAGWSTECAEESAQ